MPRNARKFKIEVGGFYHIVKRGINREKIFRSKQDYSRFILGLELFNNTQPINLWSILSRSEDSPSTANLVRERIRQARERKGKPIVEIHGFCLMPNHIHLILREIIEGGISDFIKKLGGFSTYFNKRYNRTGPLFEGRFKTIPIQSDEQLANTFRYVHTNPVELWEPKWKELRVENSGEAIKKLESYGPSSYLSYIRKEDLLPFITRDFFLEFFGNEKACQLVVEDWIKFKAQSAVMELEALE